MGRDKAALDVHGEPAAARLARVALEVASSVIVVGAPGRALPELPPGVTAIADPPDVAGMGPLAGVVAGLTAAVEARVLVLTVDALALSAGLLRALDALDQGRGVAPLDHDRLQPFPSLVPRQSALAIARAMLAAEERRASAWIDRVAPRAVTREELLASSVALRRLDPMLRALEDADDPAAAARLLAAVPTSPRGRRGR